MTGPAVVQTSMLAEGDSDATPEADSGADAEVELLDRWPAGSRNWDVTAAICRRTSLKSVVCPSCGSKAGSSKIWLTAKFSIDCPTSMAPRRPTAAATWAP